MAAQSRSPNLPQAFPALTNLTSAEAAEFLFGAHLYSQYLDWQITVIDDPDEAQYYRSPEEWDRLRESVLATVYGDLPTPLQFKNFMRRISVELYTRDQQTNATAVRAPRTSTVLALQVTIICNHAIHPGSTGLALEACPVCIMRQCVSSLKRIADVWGLVGGPNGRPWGKGLRTQLYFGIKRIWRLEKTRWANLLWDYEEFAENERRWEETAVELGIDVPDEVKDAMSCTKALLVAKESPFMFDGWDEDFAPAQRGINARIEPPKVPDIGASFDTALPHSPSRHTKADEDVPLSKHPPRSDGNIKKNDTSAPSTEGSAGLPSIPQNIPTSPTSSIDLLSSPPSPPPSNSALLPQHDQLPKPRGNITFADDNINNTAFPPRSSTTFHRKNKDYIPGRYAHPRGGDVWLNTSLMNVPLYDVLGNDDDELERDVEAAPDGDAAVVMEGED